MFKKTWLFILAIAPGIFCIGYTVGTGSVTTMATSGSWFGMKLLWALVLACIFGWALMEASGRYGVVTGKTTIHSFKTEFGKLGSFISILTIIGIVVAQWACYSGIIALSSNGLYETFRIYIPGLPEDRYLIVLIIAIVMLLVMYSLIFIGRYSFFEKILLFFVTFMGLAFILSMFISIPKECVLIK
jgi:manganese transport protein